MAFPPNSEHRGLLEYLLIIIIVILVIMLLAKLFGPAIENYIEEFLKNV